MQLLIKLFNQCSVRKTEDTIFIPSKEDLILELGAYIVMGRVKK